MSKFFFVLAMIALAAYLIGLLLMVWRGLDDDLDAFVIAAKICIVGAVVFIPSLAIYCEMEDRKSGSD